MTREIDPRQQFSKKLAKWSSIFWFFYMTALAVAMVLEPSISDAVVYISITTSVVMIVNVWAYTRNSIYEKAMRSMSDLEKIRLTWKNKGDEQSEDTGTEDDVFETEEEGGSNG